MRIAVTGGTGFLGKYVVESIKQEGNIPIVLTRNIYMNEKKDYYRNTDYSKSDLLKKLSGDNAVVHIASKRGSQGKISEFHDNEIITQNLYEACYELNITNIVFASTISVYSNEELLPWTEEQVPSPLLMYGVSKLSNEYIGNIYSNKYDLHIKNLRFAHLYGYNEKNNYMINRYFRQAYDHEQLVINRKSIDKKREFLYAKDAAKAIICSLKKAFISGTFNIGSGEALTNCDVADKINIAFENKGNMAIKDTKEDEDIQSSFMDSSKAKEVLNFIPDYTFCTAIEDIYSLMKRLDDVPLFY